MSLADSSNAIGAVTKLLTQKLGAPPINDAKAGRPAAIAAGFSGVNLFLYEIERDASMANVPLQEGEAPPLWVVLRYLLTAVKEGETDSEAAHRILGHAMARLQALNFLSPVAGTDEAKALAASGEPLKITFEPGAADLISKVTHGAGNEQFRLGVAFQVRPVAIVPAPPDRFNLLVGIDYSQNPQKVIGREGVVIDVLASMGPKLIEVKPSQFSPGDSFTLTGEDLHLAGLECVLGGTSLPITSRSPAQLVVTAAVVGTGLSAGELPLAVRQPLQNGRFRSSALLTARLLPLVTGAGFAVVTGNQVFTVQGELLGGATDDVWVVLYRNGAILGAFETAVTQANQKQLVLTLTNPLPVGPALVIVQVNGQQAHVSPAVTITP